MKDIPSDVNIKASVAAITAYALVMGTIGAYYAVQCGKHWFMYVMSYSLFAVPVLIVIYALAIWLLMQQNIIRVRYWLTAGALSVIFFGGCFVYAHLQPETALYNGNDCRPT